MTPLSRSLRFGTCLLLAAASVPASAPAASAPKLPEVPALTTVSGAPRLPGKFIWADLVTDDGPKARRFYAALFGWRFFAITPTYVIALHEETPLGGLLERPRPKDRPSQARWLGYLSVSSVSRAQQAVLKAGGKVVSPPETVRRRGEQAVFADAEGALFGVVRSSAGDPEDYLASTGEWIWIQLLSRNAHTAAEFYRDVAGYEIVENTTPGHVSDFILTSRGFARATVRTLPATVADIKPAWLPFIRVEKVGDVLGRVRELGGSVLLEPRQELLAGRVAVIADPAGAAIGILEWTPEMGKRGP